MQKSRQKLENIISLDKVQSMSKQKYREKTCLKLYENNTNTWHI